MPHFPVLHLQEDGLRPCQGRNGPAHRRLYPELAPESGREFINHSANCEDILLRWTEAGDWIHIYDVEHFPPGPPMVAQLMLAHTKNHKDGPQPVAIWSNPNGPEDPFCVCTALRTYAEQWRGTLRRGTKLFARADDKLLRYYIL